MVKKGIDKKGISPVIATVLLIALVVVIAMIIFLWFRNINEEIITKFDGENIKLACGKVAFEASYSASTLTVDVSNTGTIPISSLKYKKEGSGGYNEKTISDSALSTGEAKSFSIDKSEDETITLIPVLLGNSQDGKKTFRCDEKKDYEVA